MKLVNKIFPFLLIIVLWLLVIKSNYESGTWLLGWDSLVPEFSYKINILRSFSSVWQEYQGLGLLGGMAHAADLSRQLIMAGLSWIIPINLSRYFWHFLMLLIGPLGAYTLILQLTRNRIASFVGGGFYLLNLATVQYFYVPYEAFSSFYGFIPWFLYSSILYLESGKKRDLLKVFFVFLLGTSAFYVQTLFVVFLMVLSFFSLDFILKNKGKVKRVLKLSGAIFGVNAFWLLPVVYFGINGSQVLVNVKTSVMSTQETLLMNQGFGNFRDIFLLKGYWLEYTDLRGKEFGYLMPFWHEYTGTPDFYLIGYALFAVSVVGILWYVFQGKYRWRFSILGVYVFSILMLFSGNGFWGKLYSLLADNIPLFGQMFRSVFTKWSVIAALFYAIGIGIFISKLKKILTVFMGVLIIVGIGWQMKPVYSGNLISSNMKVDIPLEYLELFEFFKKEPKQARIARFPVQSYWGWDFYDWNYRGSGFLWYGIEQPILDRAFDGWSLNNESYYLEASNAFYQEDSQLLKDAFDKYDVSYVLVDESVITPELQEDIIKHDLLKKLLGEIDAELVWERGFLKAYKLRGAPESFIYSLNNYTNIKNELNSVRNDYLYRENGDYVFSDGGKFYPFSNATKEALENVTYTNGFNGLSYILLKSENGDEVSGKLHIPALKDIGEFYAILNIEYKGKKIFINFEDFVELEINGKKENEIDIFPEFILETDRKYEKILVKIGDQVFEVKQGGYRVNGEVLITDDGGFEVEVFDASLPRKIDLNDEFFSQPFNVCWEREGSEGSVEISKTSEYLDFEIQDLSSCSSFRIGKFDTRKILIVSLPYRSDSGGRPDYCVVEEGESECLNKEVFYHSKTSKEWESEERQVVLEKGKTYWLVVSARPPDETGSKWSILYQAPEILVSNYVGSYQLTEIFEKVKDKNWIINLDEPVENLEVIFPVLSRDFDFASKGRVGAYNCDLFERGGALKEIGSGGTAYSAIDYGASCDYLVLDEVTNQADNILRFQGNNLSGRSMKFYLHNLETGRNDLEILLPEKSFDASYDTVPWLRVADSDYILNIETKSFGGEQSENVLEAVSIYNLPLTWLQRWSFVDENIGAENHELKIGDIKKFGTFLHTTKTEGEGMLVLSQGYDEGWVAFSINNFQFSIFKHVRINSWANGWEVSGDGAVTIFYWPQLLQWAGFAILIFVIILI